MLLVLQVLPPLLVHASLVVSSGALLRAKLLSLRSIIHGMVDLPFRDSLVLRGMPQRSGLASRAAQVPSSLQERGRALSRYECPMVVVLASIVMRACRCLHRRPVLLLPLQLMGIAMLAIPGWACYIGHVIELTRQLHLPRLESIRVFGMLSATSWLWLLVYPCNILLLLLGCLPLPEVFVSLLGFGDDLRDHFELLSL